MLCVYNLGPYGGYEGPWSKRHWFQSIDYDAIEIYTFCHTRIPPKWQAAYLLLSNLQRILMAYKRLVDK